MKELRHRRGCDLPEITLPGSGQIRIGTLESWLRSLSVERQPLSRIHLRGEHFVCGGRGSPQIWGSTQPSLSRREDSSGDRELGVPWKHTGSRGAGKRIEADTSLAPTLPDPLPSISQALPQPSAFQPQAIAYTVPPPRTFLPLTGPFPCLLSFAITS